MRIILCCFCFLALFKLDAQDLPLIPKPGCCYVKQYCAPLVDTVKAKYPVYLGAERSAHKHVDLVKFIYVKEERDSVEVYNPDNLPPYDSLWSIKISQQEVYEYLPLVKTKKIKKFSPDLINWRTIKHLVLSDGGMISWTEVACSSSDYGAIPQDFQEEICAAMAAKDEDFSCKENMNVDQFYTILRKFEQKHKLKAARCNIQIPNSQHIIQVTTLDYLGIKKR